MGSRAVRIVATLAITAVSAGMFACGDDGAPSATPTPDPRTELAAQRPAWFPASFPLPARTVVVTESQSDGGGRVQFRAPVPLSRAVLILDNNLETESHAYTIVSREASETSATYEIEDSRYTGTVRLTPAEDETLIDVELKAKP